MFKGLTQWGWAVLIVGIVGAVILLLGCGPGITMDAPTDEGAKGEPVPKPTCAAWCGITLGCEGDPDPQCDDACDAFMTTCPSEQRALIACHLRLPDAGLWCTPDGYTEAREGQCSDEQTALRACWAAE